MQLWVSLPWQACWSENRFLDKKYVVREEFTLLFPTNDFKHFVLGGLISIPNVKSNINDIFQFEARISQLPNIP